MIALHRLSVKNFIGLDEVEIDFDSLRQKAGRRGVVLIVGPNGAGKSSIVEAVYFAITGWVPRFGTNKKAAIRAGRGAAYVALEFTAPNGRRYLVERFVERKDSRKHQDRLWDVESDALVAKGSGEVDREIRRIFNFSGTDNATKKFREVLRKVFTVFQGEMDQLLGTTSEARPEEILRRVGLLELDKEGINRELRGEIRRVGEKLKEYQQRVSLIVEEMSEKAALLYPFAGFDTPPDNPVEVARGLDKELLVRTIDRARRVVESRQAREEKKRLAEMLARVEDETKRVEAELERLKVDIEEMGRGYPFFSDPEFENFIGAVKGMSRNVLAISTAIVDFAEELNEWGGYRRAYEGYKNALQGIRRLIGVDRGVGRELLAQAYGWALKRLEEKYGPMSGDSREFFMELRDRLRLGLSRLGRLKEEIAGLDRRRKELELRERKRSRELKEIEAKRQEIEEQLRMGRKMLRSKAQYERFLQHYEAERAISDREKMVEDIRERLAKLQGSALLQIFDPMSEDEAWEILRRFAQRPIGGEESRRMLPDVMRASASIVAGGAADGVGIAELVSLRRELHRLESEIVALKRFLLPEKPSVPEADVRRFLESIREFEERWEALERERNLLDSRWGELTRELSAVRGQIEQLRDDLEFKRGEMRTILEKFGDEAQIMRLLGYAEFIYAVFDSLAPAAGSEFEVDFNGVDFSKLASVAKGYLAARSEIVSHLGGVLKSRLGGRLPSPDDYDAALQFALKYARILKWLRDRWTPEQWVSGVYSKYLEFKQKTHRRDELEKMFHSLIQDKAGLESRMRVLEDKEKQGRGLDDDPLVGFVLGLLGSDGSVDELAGRLLGDARNMEHMLAELVEIEKDMGQLKKRQVILKKLSTVLDSFYTWYISRRTTMFVVRLSQILSEISGRYRVESIDGVLEVSDGVSVRSISSLSGGERVMIGLAFIFALAQMLVETGKDRGGVFFVDEGFSSLDQTRKENLGEIVEGFAGGGRLIFIITHDERVRLSFPPDTITLYVEDGHVRLGVLGEVSSPGSAPSEESAHAGWEWEDV